MKVCMPGRWTATGGPASFQRKLAAGLERRGHSVAYDLRDRPYDVALVIMLTRHMAELIRAKLSGVRIVQRLDGILWRHRVQPSSLSHSIMATIRNLLMRFIRDRLADHVVYQSQFVRDWWHAEYGEAPVSYSVIYNAVDLTIFTPEGPRYERRGCHCLIAVEGNLRCDEVAIAVGVWRSLERSLGSVELLVFGTSPPNCYEMIPREGLVSVMGVVANPELPFYERGADVFISSEVNPPSPNSVVESLACGLPVVGFDTGSLSELVTPGGGICVPYGGDPWKLEPPGIPRLAEAVALVLQDQARYRQGARALAEARYGLDEMVEVYLRVLQS